ncbi:MAG: bifunctional diguanylate cyclase/phosphodiesterase [Pseudomonadota bacterium]
MTLGSTTFRPSATDQDTLQGYIAELQQQYLEMCRVRDELETSREWYRFMFQNSPVAYLCFDRFGVISDANDRALEILGQSADRVIGKPGLLFFSTAARRAFASHIHQVLSDGQREIELELALPVHGWKHVLMSSIPIPHETGQPTHCQSALINISELKRAQERLVQTRDHMETLAHHDALTGLPNRLLFMDRLDHAINRASRDNLIGAVIFFDLDRFKVINDCLGHEAGDILLKEIAHRLRETTRAEDTAARFGGDEFTVLLENVVNHENAENVARKLLATFERPVALNGQTVRVTPSIGIALFRGNELEAGEIIRRADVAMYAAKAAGGATYHSLRAADDQQGDSHAHETQLYSAQREEQYRVLIQTQVRADGVSVAAHEALVRWEHPQRGTLLPNDFVPLAEEAGFIADLGLWVLREACRQNMRYGEDGKPFARMAVNVSPLQLAAGNLVEAVETVLEETGHPADHLELEITETAVMSEPATIVDVLDRLRAMGVSIAVDDFGTGYSSLVLLKRFPINRLKIDGSFVQGLEQESSDRTIAQAIISLAQRMAMEVVAEGVETQAQFDFLNDAGCELFQGYLFSPPVERLSA